MKKQSKKSSQAEGKKGLIEVRCGKIVIRAKKLALMVVLLWIMLINKIRILRQARNRTYMDFS
ncbi:hypothetical protein CBF96_02545 [Limosilactobacillus reuteri]|uniref:Uncharacterized protein n=1 Tax=Limosilactobacillus reuteri TaxID=1598 RepID=A0A256SW10_LIMRT|nr:hypothetical protein CBF96_02545 [Limosilactobacillus reuteri]